MLDQLAEFTSGMPAWVGPDGMPISWRHFCYGMAFLRRKSHRDKIDMASSMRVAKYEDKAFQSWRNDMDMLAGY